MIGATLGYVGRPAGHQDGDPGGRPVRDHADGRHSGRERSSLRERPKHPVITSDPDDIAAIDPALKLVRPT